VITPGAPQSPVALFLGPRDWQFQAGVPYHATLEADRAVDRSAPLRAAFTVMLSEEAVQTIQPSANRYWRTDAPADAPSTAAC